MPGMHLKQPAFTDSACEPFTKNKERIQNLKKQDTSYIYKNELDEPCFQHAYEVFKDLARITASDTTFNILLKILNMMDIKEDLLLWFTNFLIKVQKKAVSI